MAKTFINVGECFILDKEGFGQSRWPRGLRPLACWECGFGSRRGHGCLSLVTVVCCQRSLRRTVHSSRGALLSVVCLSVIVKPRQWRSPGQWLPAIANRSFQPTHHTKYTRFDADGGIGSSIRSCLYYKTNQHYGLIYRGRRGGGTKMLRGISSPVTHGAILQVWQSLVS